MLNGNVKKQSVKSRGFPVSFALVMALCTGSLLAGEVTFQSEPTRGHLLELFTSEGCSSCPPAEAWLSKLKENPQLWTDFVPIAFHVDYWDHLGWRDPVASNEWTARQQSYAAHWSSSSVYTPGFVLDGREWKNDRAPVAGPDTPGILKIACNDTEHAAISFSPAEKPGRTFDVHVAQLGFGLSVSVKAGENGGRKLLHDFVVLSMTSQRLKGAAEFHLPAINSNIPPTSRRALAAWVTEAGNPEPVQVTGGWLP